MFMIVGLGNPGDKYIGTRHNAGYMVIDALSERFNIKVDRMKHRSLIGTGMIENEKVILVKPQTFMNLSGEAVLAVKNFYKIENSHIIIIYDDIDIDLGKIRVRRSGSAGSHNGMKSVIGMLKGDDFPRIRVGIDTPPRAINLVEYVMSKFQSCELDNIMEAVDKAAYAAELIVTRDVSYAMNKCNGG